MDFSEKIKKFKNEKNLNNREFCKAIGGYSETLFSKQIRSKKAPTNLVIVMGKYFSIDFNYWLKDDEVINKVEEQSSIYQNRKLELVEEIEEKLSELKKMLPKH